MKLIVGLGNPEKKFKLNRHNIGFNIVDHLVDFFGAEKCSLPFKKTIINMSFYIHKRGTVLFLKPMDWMNFSGRSVGRVVNKIGFGQSDVMVIYDDVDFDFGDYKIKSSGRSGGHNGVQSVIDNIGKNFARFRVGVGRPDDPKVSIRDYVLSDFSVYEQKDINKIKETSVHIVSSFVVHGVQETMNVFNRKRVEK